ncbi:MAG: hypothetical protein M3350_06785 [Actinomycetota bacterium]|nr:hypothetical protein [Actinomycetota bacterium]
MSRWRKPYQQSEVHCADAGMGELGRAHPRLPDDLVNFHYDPIACAVALGWPGAVIDRMPLRALREDEVLRVDRADEGRLTNVVVDLDAEGFPETWLAAVQAAQA